MKCFATLITLSAILILAGNAFAECNIDWLECDGNGIFQPGGERSGGDYYFNIEGANNGSYASWAGARWTNLDMTPEPGYVCEIDQICITLGQANAGFTTNGLVKLYLAPKSIASEVEDGGNLAYPYAAGGTLLETYNFVETSNGYQDAFCFEPGDPGFEDLADSIMDGTLVLAFVEGDANVAATWGGIGNYSNSMGGPRLDVSCTCSAVPEPSTMLLIAAMGSVFACMFIKRHKHNQ